MRRLRIALTRVRLFINVLASLVITDFHLSEQGRRICKYLYFRSQVGQVFSQRFQYLQYHVAHSP
jgi:hypothetical protein